MYTSPKTCLLVIIGVANVYVSVIILSNILIIILTAYTIHMSVLYNYAAGFKMHMYEWKYKQKFCCAKLVYRKNEEKLLLFNLSKYNYYTNILQV